MKSNFNDYTKRYSKKNKEVIFQRKINFSSKINNFNTYMSSSIPKTNKTLKKYINSKLNVMKKKSNNLFQQQNSKSISNVKTILIYKNENNFFNSKKNLIPKDTLLKHKNINGQIYSKKSISKNKYNYVKNLNTSTDNSKSFTCLLKRKQSKKQLKLINSVSTSAGMSSASNKIDDNGRFTYQDYHTNNNCINTADNTNITYDKKNSKRYFLEESNQCKHKINNFNYETGSDDNLNDNIIFLKNDNNSSLTFGNSFTYSNSQRSKSTKKNENVENINNQLTLNNNNNNYLTKLKEENETLKKELKESNEQISFLKYRIQKLKEDNSNENSKNNSRNIIFPPNIWNKRFIKYELLQKKNNFKIIKEFSLDNGMSERTKFKKEFIQKLNHTINDNNLNSDNRKKINVKRNLNLKKKIIKKHENEFSSFFLDKPCEKITECITNLKL